MSKINSEIIENNDELDVIKSEIEKKINKQIKGINKLYQATKDGGELEIFHKKCDNIPNTLVLYKTLGNRRFGGFTSKLWQNIVTIDKNCFLFSLDKKKIYPQKNENYYSIVSHSDNQGFLYKSTYIIQLQGNAIKNKNIRTNENDKKLSKLLFNNEKNALSEDGNWTALQAKEYEVFEIEF